MKSTSGRGAAAAAMAQTTDSLEVLMFREMLDKSPINVMWADTSFVIRYINAASKQTLSKIAHLLPCKVEAIVGSSIDIFHKNPEHQRRLLSDERNLPHKALIHLNDEILDLRMQAVHDGHGNYCGAMVTWDVVTEKLRLEKDNSEYRAQFEAMKKSVAFYTYQVDGTIIEANEEFGRLMGYAHQELKGKNASMFVEERVRQSAEYQELWAKLRRG